MQSAIFIKQVGVDCRHPSKTVAGLKGASSQKKLMRDRLRMQGILDSYRQQKTPDQVSAIVATADGMSKD